MKLRPQVEQVLRISIAVVLCVLGFLALGPGSQTWNLRVAKQHAQQLTPMLAEDERFASVYIGEYTGLGGVLSVAGCVPDHRAAYDLRLLVESVDLYVPVYYSVRVFYDNYDFYHLMDALHDALHEDERFQELQFDIDDSWILTIRLHARVPDEQAAIDLRELVEQTQLGVPIEYDIRSQLGVPIEYDNRWSGRVRQIP
ncbi:hypothetical protein [Mucisphaera calidilacus]|uniref:Uncharacterized protein n=1 Tax=Mucisphaera calidilacus TaxID=2527982 RepID=A0A518BXC5_9BACT|nr:hypothetical protein [Mucisphaera calidilacus]QDU71616.1 hypothetical protein Pan265_14680 [Mucisphaera calidilacus]